MGVGLWADDILDWEPAVLQVAVGRHMDMLEVVEQRGTIIPRRILGPVYHVVTLQGTDGNEPNVRDVQTARKAPKGFHDFLM